MKKILLVIFILALCAGTGFAGCLGFLLYVFFTDKESLTGKKDKEYDPNVHRQYLIDRKL